MGPRKKKKRRRTFAFAPFLSLCVRVLLLIILGCRVLDAISERVCLLKMVATAYFYFLPNLVRFYLVLMLFCFMCFIFLPIDSSHCLGGAGLALRHPGHFARR